MTARARTAVAAAVAAALAAVVALAGCTATEAGTRPHRTPPRPAEDAFVPFQEHVVDEREAMYPRLVRLRDGRIVLSVATSSGGGLTDMARFYESGDGGRTFRALSEIRDPAAAAGRGSCCGSLLELPRAVGAQPAGTLLWAGTVGMKNDAPERLPELRVWRSADGGRHWSYLSSCATADAGTPSDRGLWEPELSLDAQGRLVCYYSDETRPGHDQVIMEALSLDGGATWGSRTPVVALRGRGDRPGMPVVRRLPGGSYFMAYEICGPAANCGVHYRRSPDGLAWGDPAAPGAAARTADGRGLYHAPTVAWVPGGGPDGTVLLVGGIVRDARGRLARDASGGTVLAAAAAAAAGDADGTGGWRAEPAPVRVSFPSEPGHSDIVCANYSSTLLPTSDGKGLLEVATERGKDGVCRAYAGASLRTGP